MDILEFFHLGKGKVLKCSIEDKMLTLKVYVNGSDMIFRFIGEDFGLENTLVPGHSWFENDNLFFIISGEKRQIGFRRPAKKNQTW